jgi:hypothetical protein
VPPLGVKGEKLTIALPTVRLCAVVVAVALIDIEPLLFVLAFALPPPPPPQPVNDSAERMETRKTTLRIEK